jgi:hypothetical protein
MPQLDVPMFIDQITFFSLIFFMGHVYVNEVLLPNISTVKQYRQYKIVSYDKKGLFYTFFIVNSNSDYSLKLKFMIFDSNNEIKTFKHLLIFLVSFNYKFFKKICKESAKLNDMLTNILVKNSISI